MDSTFDKLTKAKSTLLHNVAELVRLKSEEPSSAEKLRSIVTECSSALVKLRELNRKIIEAEDETKAATEAAKIPVDRTSLKLNNLLYEKNYYVKSIKACNDYTTKHPDIEIISEDQFLKECAPETGNDDSLMENSHLLMIRRLEFELLQRKNLLQKRKILEAKKKQLSDLVHGKRKSLHQFKSKIPHVKAACLPLAEQLGIDLAKKSTLHVKAKSLPVPLFKIFTNLIYGRDSLGFHIDLEILDDSLADSAVQSLDPSNETSNKRPKLSASVPQADGKGSNPGNRFPRLMLTIHRAREHSSDWTPVQIQFEVSSDFDLVYASPAEGCSVPLGDLVPGDRGELTPLQKLESEALAHHLEETMKGKPFIWAQTLAGINVGPGVQFAGQNQSPVLKIAEVLHSLGASVKAIK